MYPRVNVSSPPHTRLRKRFTRNIPRNGTVTITSMKPNDAPAMLNEFTKHASPAIQYKPKRTA